MQAQQCTLEVVRDGEGYAVVARGTNRDGGNTSVVLAWYPTKNKAQWAADDIEEAMMLGYA